jgi:hypothetical protein
VIHELSLKADLPAEVRKAIEMAISDIAPPTDPAQLLYVKSEGDLKDLPAHCNFVIDWKVPAG